LLFFVGAMRRAVDFYDQPRANAGEVGDKRTNRMLSPKAVTAGTPLLELRPEDRFRIGKTPSQLLCIETRSTLVVTHGRSMRRLCRVGLSRIASFVAKFVGAVCPHRLVALARYSAPPSIASQWGRKDDWRGALNKIRTIKAR